MFSFIADFLQNYTRHIKLYDIYINHMRVTNHIINTNYIIYKKLDE